jgi:hypothetical protein
MINLIKAFNWLRFGTLQPIVTKTEHGFASEIAFFGRNDKLVGVYSYGYYYTTLPYKGQPCQMTETIKKEWL